MSDQTVIHHAKGPATARASFHLRSQGRPRVLLVEDQPYILLYLAQILRLAGFSVLEASSAAYAMAYLAEGGYADLLLCDIELPDSIDGLTLAERVRQHLPDIPVVFASGNAARKDHAQGHAFLLKPFSAATVVSVVAEALGLDDQARHWPPEDL